MKPIPTHALSTTSSRNAPASSSIVSFSESDSRRCRMNIAVAPPTASSRRLFLGVQRSVCGRAWRDRLDERGQTRALAIAQRHDNVPELLARILAGRGVEVEDVPT